jgi:ABC-type uncharacterized transport system permease subunit
MVGALLGLLMFASPVAIGAVFSIGAIAQYTAFIIPIALKLFVVGDKFRPGEFVALAFNFISSLFHLFLRNFVREDIEKYKERKNNAA